jgi:hypothetical protein
MKLKGPRSNNELIIYSGAYRYLETKPGYMTGSGVFQYYMDLRGLLKD